MNVIEGNPGSNDLAHYLDFYILCDVEKFHSYQRITVSGLGGEKRKKKKKSSLTYHCQFQNLKIDLLSSSHKITGKLQSFRFTQRSSP